MPEQYIDFMKRHNGGEGDIGESWFVLFAIDELQEIMLIGRVDRGDGNADRQEISKLTPKLDRSQEWIVLDHQPSDYKNVKKPDVIWYCPDIPMQGRYGRRACLHRYSILMN